VNRDNLHITEIDLSAFKGLTRTTPLGRLNLFTGPNGGGKTAHALAPSFAITGATSLGKTLDDSFQFSSQPRGCSVELRLSDGFRFTRGITKDHRESKLSSFLDVRGHEGLGLKDADALVSKRVGRFAPMFDVSEFLALSPDRRRAFLLDLCARKRGGSDVDASDLCNRAALTFLVAELGDGTVETFLQERFNLTLGLIRTCETRAKVVETIIAEKMAPDRATTLRELLSELLGQIKGELSAAIGSGIEYLRQAANAAKSQSEAGYNAARELSARKAQAQVIAGDIAAMKAQRTSFEDEYRAAIEKVGQAQGREAADRNLRESIVRIDRQIVDLSTKVRELEGIPAEPTEEADRLESEAAGIDVSREKMEELQEAERDLMARDPRRTIEALHVGTTQSEADSCLEQETESAAAIAQGEAMIEAEQNRRKMLAAAIDAGLKGHWARCAELIDLIGQQHPAVVPSPEWQELMVLIRGNANVHAIESQKAELVAIDGPLAKAVESLARLREGHKGIIATRVNAEAAFKKAREQFEAYVAKLDADRTAARAAIIAEQSRLQEAVAKADELRARAARLRNGAVNRAEAIRKTNEDIAKHQADRAAQKAELDTLRAQAGVASIAALIEVRDTLASQIADLKKKIELKEAAAILDRELTECTAQAERRGLAHEVAKELGLAIKKLREAMMAELIAPAKTLIDRFLAAALDGCESYVSLENDRGTAVFEIGWVYGGNRIALPALSGGERCIFVAALAYALTVLADPPLKLLILEASEIDESNLLRLMTACEAVSGDLGNVLVATHLQIVEAAGPWNIVRCVQTQGSDIETAMARAV